MATPALRWKIVKFGSYEFEPSSGELRKLGRLVRLPLQSAQVLALLVERPNQLITREELQKAIWPADTFVDFDLGLDAAVYKLRQAVGDSADNPRFIATLPRKGYRFIAPVQVDAAELETKAEADSLPLASVAHAQPKTDPLHSTAAKLGIAALILAAAVSSLWFAWRPKPQAYVIAVLPFKNLSSEPNSDYFSDGLTDDIIGNLSLIDGLQVKSRTSSFALKDKPHNTHQVGAELGVNLVLEGSVFRAGDKLRVNAQLVRVADDTQVWSGHFDRELKDVFAIQDEISRSIVTELRLKLGATRRRYDIAPETYDLYLRAKALANHLPAGHGAELRQALSLLDEVVRRDPEFAPAHASKATILINMSAGPRENFEGEFEEGKQAAERAIQLDPLLAQAHGEMGLVHARELKWTEAEQSFRRALQLDPNLSYTRHEFATFVLLPLGKMDEALQQAKKAAELDPLSDSSLDALCFLSEIVAPPAEALRTCERVRSAQPDDYFAKQLYARALALNGRYSEAIAIGEPLPAGNHGMLGYDYAKAGRRRDAERLAAEPDVALTRHQAWIYAGLGDVDRCLEALHKMADMKDPLADVYPLYPELAVVRRDPRLNEFRGSRGLPPLPSDPH